MSSTGKINASQLQLVPRGSQATEPVDIDYTISHDLETRKGTVSDIAVHAGSVAVHVNGSFLLTQEAVMLDLHLAAPNLPIDQLERLLPVVGIHLPSGSSLQGGTLTANIAVSGPATTATFAGPIEIDDTKLAGFDLGSKIQGLNPFGSTSGATEIQVLKADVNSSPTGARITHIYGNLPQTRLGNGRRHGCGNWGDQLQPERKAEFVKSRRRRDQHGHECCGRDRGEFSTSHSEAGVSVEPRNSLDDYWDSCESFDQGEHRGDAEVVLRPTITMNWRNCSPAIH